MRAQREAEGLFGDGPGDLNVRFARAALFVAWMRGVETDELQRNLVHRSAYVLADLLYLVRCREVP